MQRIWIAVALLPLAGLAVGGSVAAGCAEEDGETVSTTMVPLSGQRAEGMYVYAAPDVTAGIYFETNGKAGLQVTDLKWTCGTSSTPIREADDRIDRYLA